MLVSHRHRFIYTKTVKTAGTSVEIYFEDACLPPDSDIVRGHAIAETVTDAGIIGYRGVDPGESRYYNHMPASDVRALVGPEVWDSYFKFCVIRNPFDKIVSLWWADRQLRPALPGYRARLFRHTGRSFPTGAHAVGCQSR